MTLQVLLFHICLNHKICSQENYIEQVSIERGQVGYPDSLPLVVCQCDALRRHLEVHNGGSRWRSSCQCLRYCLGNSLRACQGLHLHWVDVEHIACWKEERRADIPVRIRKTLIGGCEDLVSITKLAFIANRLLLKILYILTCSCIVIEIHAIWSKAEVKQFQKQTIPHKMFSLLCAKGPDTHVNRQNIKKSNNKQTNKKTFKGICSHRANNKSFHLCKLQHKDNRQTTHR